MYHQSCPSLQTLLGIVIKTAQSCAKKKKSCHHRALSLSNYSLLKYCKIDTHQPVHCVYSVHTSIFTYQGIAPLRPEDALENHSLVTSNFVRQRPWLLPKRFITIQCNFLMGTFFKRKKIYIYTRSGPIVNGHRSCTLTALQSKWF